MPCDPEEAARFRLLVYAHYAQYGRTLPWRETRDPYAILVSEFMLQQTPVQRVLQKYPPFMEAFPSFGHLARAPLSEVLEQWRGLGYNRRALFLSRCAEAVVERFDGELPVEVATLQSLPGVGAYTARAVAAFAYGAPTVFIETNIRALFLHYFFPEREGVTDRELTPLVKCTLDRSDPRTWYYALMDLGAHLKRREGNPGRRSAHHATQSPFRGSNREMRSRILQAVLADPGITCHGLLHALLLPPDVLARNLAQLEREGFLTQTDSGYRIS